MILGRPVDVGTEVGADRDPMVRKYCSQINGFFLILAGPASVLIYALADLPSPRPSCVAPLRWLLPRISGWPATRPLNPTLPRKDAPDQPGHPIDNHRREPNGEHHPPRHYPFTLSTTPAPSRGPDEFAPAIVKGL